MMISEVLISGVQSFAPTEGVLRHVPLRGSPGYTVTITRAINAYAIMRQ